MCNSNFNLITSIGEYNTVTRTSDSFVNVTEMYKSYNAVKGTDKRLDNYFNSLESRDYVQAVVDELNEDKCSESEQLKKSDIVKSARGKYGSTWCHQLVALDAAAYLEPRLKVKAYKVLLGMQDRITKRLNAAEKTKTINSKLAKLNAKSPDSMFETSKLIRATNRKINTIAFGEHYDNIRNEKNSVNDLKNLSNAFDAIENLIDTSNNIEEYVSAMKSLSSPSN